MTDFLVILVTLAFMGLIAWFAYDWGYDNGWHNRDEGKP